MDSGIQKSWSLYVARENSFPIQERKSLLCGRSMHLAPLTQTEKPDSTEERNKDTILMLHKTHLCDLLNCMQYTEDKFNFLAVPVLHYVITSS